MKSLLQRVSNANVRVDGNNIAEIGHGLLVLVGFESADDAMTLEKMLRKLLGYRVFADQDGKMNLNLQQVEGGLLLVPQFTLVADTARGLRPSFSRGASPEQGRKLFEQLLAMAHKSHSAVAAGRFGADMQVSLTNDGPVTFSLHS